MDGLGIMYVSSFFARFLLFELEQCLSQSKGGKTRTLKKEIHDVKDIADDVDAAKATNSKSRSLTLFVIDGKKVVPRTARHAE